MGILKFGWIALVLGACHSAGAGLGEQDKWKVGSDLDNPPFAWVDEAGVAQGRDVEMAQALAEEMGVELIWDRMPFDQLLDTLEAGRLDSVIATMGSTPERAQRVLLSRPYYVTDLRVVVRRGAQEPKTLKDLHGLRVSAGAGTTSEKALLERLPLAIAAEASPKGTPSLDRLLAREVDALVMDGPDALDYERDYPEQLALINSALAEERYIVAVRPEGEIWLSRIDAALATLQATGRLSALNAAFGLK